MPNFKKTVLMLSASLSMLMSAPILLADDQGAMKEDKKHVNSWNNFADQLLVLHKKQIAKYDTRTSEKSGGYADSPDYYNEITYADKKTGQLISMVQWEKRNPKNVHSLEVYVFDDKNRVIRDYTVAYLPYHRNAPIQTLINIHGYNKKLHAFRQFVGSSDVIYQYCEGSFEGKEVQMRLFEDDLVATDYDARQLLKSPVYKACFSRIRERPGKYIQPQ